MNPSWLGIAEIKGVQLVGSQVLAVTLELVALRLQPPNLLLVVAVHIDLDEAVRVGAQ